MNKKTKILVGIVILILLIGFIFGISTIVKFCKLQSILSKVNENVEKNNFFMRTTIVNKGVSQITETYYRDGVGKFVSNNGTYIWSDGTNAYSIDEINKTAIILDTNETIGVINKESFASLYPGYTDGFFKRLMIAGNVSTKIKTDYHNGKKCTIITVVENEYTKTFWISKEMNNLIKAEIEFANGDIYEYKYDLIFHSTQLIDVRLPDITEYTITNGATGEKVETNTLNNDIKLETQNVVVENVSADTKTTPVG